jgi:hypothetical protein
MPPLSLMSSNATWFMSSICWSDALFTSVPLPFSFAAVDPFAAPYTTPSLTVHDDAARSTRAEAGSAPVAVQSATSAASEASRRGPMIISGFPLNSRSKLRGPADSTK